MTRQCTVDQPTVTPEERAEILEVLHGGRYNIEELNAALLPHLPEGTSADDLVVQNVALYGSGHPTQFEIDTMIEHIPDVETAKLFTQSRTAMSKYSDD